jgi:hypothetical protein
LRDDVIKLSLNVHYFDVVNRVVCGFYGWQGGSVERSARERLAQGLKTLLVPADRKQRQVKRGVSNLNAYRLLRNIGLIWSAQFAHVETASAVWNCTDFSHSQTAGFTFSVQPNSQNRIELGHSPIMVYSSIDLPLFIWLGSDSKSAQVTVTGLDNKDHTLFTTQETVENGDKKFNINSAWKLRLSSDQNVWLEIVCFQ